MGLLRNLIAAICQKKTCGAFRFVMLSPDDSDSRVNHPLSSLLFFRKLPQMSNKPQMTVFCSLFSLESTELIG